MPTPRHRTGSAAPLTEAELDELQDLLDTVPAPLEPLDVSMLDGYLCGVLVQPRPIEAKRWWAHVTDADGRALPPGFDAARLHELALRRHAELNAAIASRRWFDPWVFELDDDPQADDSDSRGDEADEDMPPAIDAVYPWVAGFATALELFPALMRLDASALTEPLALLYRHLAPDDLEDADELLAEIETLEPPVDLEEAVEGLVRATLLLADVGRPLAAPSPNASGRRHPGAPRRR
ncbi:MAG TPA: YecA family protein [Burkholderiaceae bacterium]|nr:YecA family protein [Burkholderiaceae bacterium]